MSATLIRERVPEDFPALADVLVRVHARDGYPVEGVADALGWLTPPSAFAAWSAVRQGQVIGQATLAYARPNDDAARVWLATTGSGDITRLAIPARLFVDPHQRRHGAGALLMRTAMQHARARQLAVAFDVMLKDQAAIRLYEGAGCVRIGTIEHDRGDGSHEAAAVYLAP
ncbi:MAG: GNAT family N-acetyltransferase [Nocardioides sp.]